MNWLLKTILFITLWLVSSHYSVLTGTFSKVLASSSEEWLTAPGVDLTPDDSDSTDVEQGPAALAQLLENDMATANITAAAIHHSKQFKGGPTLAYITPWHRDGYDVAKQYHYIFDYLSPTWFLVERHATLDYKIVGEHDISLNWLESIQTLSKEKRGKIVPRFSFHQWQYTDYIAFVNDQSEQQALVEEIVDMCRKYKFDGLVLETSITHLLSPFIRLLSTILRQDEQYTDNLPIIVVVIPPYPPPTSDNSDGSLPLSAWIDQLGDSVDAFSLMSYDYTVGGHGNGQGPNAPLEWMRGLLKSFELNRQSLHHPVLLLGLNLYGYILSEQQAPRAIIGKDFMALVQQHGFHSDSAYVWDIDSKEHVLWYLVDNIAHAAWYPSMESIRLRLKLAEEYKVGIALWEIGQGLNMFYDLF
ncbi:glycoside hydrolase superfamily [Syncephalis fuscata]|nr:glycoside hydrolase superfamily [Syncephalis fuscata]